MSVGEFLRKTVVPVISVALLYLLFRPLCVEQGVMEWPRMILLIGIPFGIQKMFLWLVPWGMGIGEMIGILAVNLLVGGVIGSVVMGWRLLVAIVILAKAVVACLRRVIRIPG
ncbi:MAG: DUF6050 family protein [Lachnospiraceae bacterium]|nr:DUF6050 family protein [Lachnospiraceae bacterium]